MCTITLQRAFKRVVLMNSLISNKSGYSIHNLNTEQSKHVLEWLITGQIIQERRLKEI